MKRFLIVIIAGTAMLGLLAWLSGCGASASADADNLSQEKYEKIKTGMSTDALKTIAGEPAKTEAKSMGGGHSMGGGSMSGESMTMEYWYYQGSKGWVRIEVGDNKVLSKSGY
jgi:hypothetical protein